MFVPTEKEIAELFKDRPLPVEDGWHETPEGSLFSCEGFFEDCFWTYYTEDGKVLAILNARRGSNSKVYSDALVSWPRNSSSFSILARQLEHTRTWLRNNHSTMTIENAVREACRSQEAYKKERWAFLAELEAQEKQFKRYLFQVEKALDD